MYKSVVKPALKKSQTIPLMLSLMVYTSFLKAVIPFNIVFFQTFLQD